MKTSLLRATSVALSGVFVIALPAFASYDGVADSIHFYNSASWGDEDYVDFGRAPVEVNIVGWTKEPRRDGSVYTSGWDFEGPYKWDTDWVQRQKTIRDKARNLEVAGRFSASINAYKKLDPLPGVRAFIRDREELFRATRYRNSQDLQSYLRARFLSEFGEASKAVPILQKLRNGPKAIRPHVAYAIAAAGPNGRMEVADRYLSVYRQFPKSERAESALMMTARSLLQDASQKPDSEQIAKASQTLDLLLDKFPQTRFKDNAFGWKGRCAYLKGQWAIAAGYYTKQARSSDPSEAWTAHRSLATICRASGRHDRTVVTLLRQWHVPATSQFHFQGVLSLRDNFEKLSPEQTKAVQSEIKRDPELLEAYLSFRIEHTELSLAEESKLMAFATSILSQTKRAPAGLVARVAQINYNAGRYQSARLLAQRVIRRRVDSETRARARYVLASSNARLGRSRQAIRELEILLEQRPPGFMKQAAGEYLALMQERHGDPVQALQRYIQLGYRYDAAFLADAKLTTRELTRAINSIPWQRLPSLISGHDEYDYRLSIPSRPGEPDRDVLIYTLGMRYLRAEKYVEARRTFQRLSKQARLNWGLPKSQAETLAKDGFYHDKPLRIDPVKTVTDLERFTRLAKTVKSSEARAQALYDKAAYIYQRRHLLFYSPALWEGNRAFMVDMWWNDKLNGHVDNRALERHYYEHECYAHSLRICDELVAKYPKSKVTPKALYTAALSAERLSNLNSWWRGEKGLREKAINRLDRLVKQFPNDPLAKPAAKYKGVFLQMAKQSGF